MSKLPSLEMSQTDTYFLGPGPDPNAGQTELESVKQRLDLISVAICTRISGYT